MTKLEAVRKIEEIERDIDMHISKNQRERELKVTITQMQDEIGELQDRLHKLYDEHREAMIEFNDITERIVQ